jgi:hypothetical protein
MGKRPRNFGVRIPDSATVQLACEGDLNKVWGEFGVNPPRERITINEAILAGTSREEDPFDRLPRSRN